MSGTSTWRLLYGPVGSGLVLGELPFEACSVAHTLNAPGSIRASLPLARSGVTLPLPGQVPPPELDPSTLAEGRTALYLERDGLILGSGVLWTVNANVDSATLELAGEGWLSYYRRRRIRDDLTFDDVEQTAIAAALVTYAESLGRGIGTSTADVTPTGVLRDRTYVGRERKNIGEAIEELAAVEGGFDFTFDTVWQGSTLVKRLLTSTPTTGRETSIVLELGTNVDVLGYSGNGTTLANVVDGFGSGDGADQVTTEQVDLDALAEYPQLDDVVSHTDVTVLGTLVGHARRRLARGRWPVRQASVSVFPDTVPVLGSYAVGDVVTVRGRHGYLDLRDERMRITQLEVSVGGDGDNVRLALAAQEVFG